MTSIIRNEARSDHLDHLDDEQRDLLRRLVQGHTIRDVAKASYVSPRTVKRRIAELLEALGVDSRMEAAYLAGRASLLEDEVGVGRPS